MSKLPSEAGRAESRKWGPSFTVAVLPLHSPLFLAHGGGAGWEASLLFGLTASHCHVLSSLIFQILSQLKRLPPVSFLISFFFYWSIVDLQICVHFRCRGKSFSYIYIHIFFRFFSLISCYQI